MEQQELVAGLDQKTDKKQVLVHYLLIVLLATVLISLIAGYIYYGMQRAKGPAEVPVEEEMPAPNEAAELTPEQRQAILDSLASEVEENPLSPEDRQAILDSLQNSVAPEDGEPVEPELSPEDRRAILESL